MSLDNLRFFSHFQYSLEKVISKVPHPLGQSNPELVTACHIELGISSSLASQKPAFVKILTFFFLYVCLLLELFSYFLLEHVMLS